VLAKRFHLIFFSVRCPARVSIFIGGAELLSFGLIRSKVLFAISVK
jgi:hypothetical protein